MFLAQHDSSDLNKRRVTETVLPIHCKLARDLVTVSDVAARTGLSITAVSLFNVREHAKIDTKGSGVQKPHVSQPSKSVT